ncbi:MAG TPA: hypothetical protein VFD70_19545 [Anaerolineae bacterium]|nr:hypothetical protein [Anaerolineae bacterium]
MNVKRDINSDVIRASDVGEYIYCHRAWWLGRVQGVPNANRAALDAGTQRHRAHGRRVWRASLLQYAAIALALVALLAAFLLAFKVAGLF